MPRVRIAFLAKAIEVTVNAMLRDVQAHVRWARENNYTPKAGAEEWQSFLDYVVAEVIGPGLERFRSSGPSVKYDMQDIGFSDGGKGPEVVRRAKAYLLDQEKKAHALGVSLDEDGRLGLQILNDMSSFYERQGIQPEPFDYRIAAQSAAPAGTAKPASPDRQQSSPPAWITAFTDDKLREVVSLAWSEADRAAAADLPLASTVMRGAVLEAVLIVLLERRLPEGHSQKERLREARLEDLIKTAQSEGILSELAANCAVCARIARNLVHPHRLLQQEGALREINSLPELVKAWTNAAAGNLESSA